ncbi:hypothetical protein [Streptomyces sp. NPDC088246]|uniref:hypothetical protein n=1 Tax=Streptomyces sp. NPDC088246 TaxID=3365842 RepID=UPI00382D88BD
MAVRDEPAADRARPGRCLQPPRASPSFAEHVENPSTAIIDRISGPRDTDDEERATTTSERSCR